MLGAILYCLIPVTGRSGSVIFFVSVCVVILSMYGGGFATIPAFLKDLFGAMQVGAIHGRLLTAWSVAGVLGPVLVNYIREYLKNRGVAGVGLYAPTMYLMAGLLVIGLICNLAVRPVAERYFYRNRREALGSKEPMPNETKSTANAVMLLVSWVAVGVPLFWGVYKTLTKLPALFQ